ncbi:MAG: 23S rRNA (adenine(2503)-C(2))-methyltransferase RlmN [Holosporaceae bacterium]|jgi:23S rRNA (adenine2503-C2)-methyltransferase|nr:23S rRNA (adenine(2503)-C(2))-methyltransferase RlmN [Holosporaceae bacterium]
MRKIERSASRVNLLGLTFDQLKSEFSQAGLTPLDAKRVFPWIHMKLAKSFDVMTDAPLRVRKILKENYSIDRPECAVLQKSSDGTQKALLKLEDENFIETVLIPEEKRTTVCVSSQIGCAMGCKFCRTGTQKFTRNLTAAEIISQVFFWKDLFPKTITNIVFMGMGEPLLNFENLSNALTLLLSEKAHNFSRHKITVSTSGIVENAIADLAKFGVKLAISLHASDDEKRSSIMPVNRKYPMENVLRAAKEYLQNSNTSHITFEYLLLRGANDSDEDAIQLVKLLRSIKCRVNLILFNNWPGSSFSGSDRNKANNFSRLLLSRGIRAVVRKSRGEDILAACGQLSTEQNRFNSRA